LLAPAHVLTPLLCALAACTTIDVPDPEPPHLDPWDGVEEAIDALTDLTSQCSFDPDSGLFELDLNDGDIALITRASDGKVVVNGFPCGDAAVTTVKQIAVAEGAAGDQTLILDFSAGQFATGKSAAPGITVDLGAAGSNDALKIMGSTGVDTYTFGTSGLTINSDGFVDVTSTNAEQIVVSLGDGNDVFSGAGSTAAGDPLPAAIDVYGGRGDDRLRGGAGDDFYSGGEGNDTFPTGDADDGGDAINGGGGTDLLDYSTRSAPVTVSIDGVANDGAGGGAEADDVKADVETLKGTGGDDSLTGGAGAQTLHGGAGNDILAGGAGNDTLNGDAGDDRLDEGSSASGSDVLNGGAGIDLADYSARTMAVVVTLDTTANDGQSGETDKIAVDVENVSGGTGNDRLTGSNAANLLDGGGGDDTLNGGDAADTLRGGLGNDTLEGGNGNDTLDAEAAPNGNDTMRGGAGIDLVTYGARGSQINVTMDGLTPGGESGEADRIATDVENLRAGPADDMVVGNDLDNLLEGGDGIDQLSGAAGDDTIDGEAGEDTIDCGPGDGDVLLDGTIALATDCEL
jgi:Ca2+-binding RTX toxin-like protein